MFTFLDVSKKPIVQYNDLLFGDHPIQAFKKATDVHWKAMRLFLSSHLNLFALY